VNGADNHAVLIPWLWLAGGLHLLIIAANCPLPKKLRCRENSVLFAMVFAGAWAIGEYPLQPFVHLAQMAKFHGTANATGFTVCGLLGWTIAGRGATPTKGEAQ